MKHVLGIAAILCGLLSADAAQLRVSLLPDRTRTTPDQPVRITLTIVSDTDLGQLPAPVVPASEDFSVQRVDRNQSSSSTISITGGRSERRVEITYYFYYLVAPKKLGSFTFPALSFIAGGESYHTQPVTITVQEASVRALDVIVRLRSNKTSLYVGEQTLFSVLIGQKPGTSVELTTEGFRALLNSIRDASAHSFSLVDITRGQIAGVEEILDGERYIVFKAEFLLIPVASGAHTLGPVPMQYRLLTQSQRRTRDPFEDFFGGSFFGRGVTATPATVMSNSLRITVTALPRAPADFCGSIGPVTLGADISPKDIRAGEAATLRISLRAPVRPGSLVDILLPHIATAEVFTPERLSSVDTSRTGIQTRRTYRYLLIPRVAGTLEIPPVTVSWFDPAAGAYRQSTTGPLTLAVSKGDTGQTGTRRYLTQEDIREVGRDIRYIKMPPRLTVQSRYPHRSVILYAAGLLPFIIVLFSLLYRLQAERHARDPSLALRKTAYRVLCASLRRCDRAAPRQDMLGTLSTAFDTYLSRRFGFAAAAMTGQERDTALTERGVDTETRDALARLFNSIDSARFGATGSDAATRAALLESARAVGERLERCARRRST